MKKNKDTNCNVCDAEFGDKRSRPRQDHINPGSKVCTTCYQYYRVNSKYVRSDRFVPSDKDSPYCDVCKAPYGDKKSHARKDGTSGRVCWACWCRYNTRQTYVRDRLPVPVRKECDVCGDEYDGGKTHRRFDGVAGRTCGACRHCWDNRGCYERTRIRNGSSQDFVERVVAETAGLPENSPCVLWPYAKNPAGYGVANLNGRTIVASRAILILHTGEDDPELFAAHACLNKNCVSVAHLSWKTPLENVHDKYRDGTMLHGEQIHASKLKENDVREIRELGKTMGPYKIAKIYGTSGSTIVKILNGESWKHVT